MVRNGSKSIAVVSLLMNYRRCLNQTYYLLLSKYFHLLESANN